MSERRASESSVKGAPPALCARALVLVDAPHQLVDVGVGERERGLNLEHVAVGPVPGGDDAVLLEPVYDELAEGGVRDDVVAALLDELDAAREGELSG